MEWTRQKIKEIVRAQLAIDYGCAPDDFDKEGILFTRALQREGRRPFSWFTPRLDMITMGKSVVITASDDVMPQIKEQLVGKTRDEAFSMPFAVGPGPYFLPDVSRIAPLAMPQGFAPKIVERREIPALYALSGFSNALMYDEGHERPDVLAVLAMHDGEVAGIAGASADCARMWQIGVDVLPSYRGLGIAAALTGRLALAILERGIVPYYGTSASNLASIRTALRAGFAPAWVSIYRARLDGSLTQPVC